MMDVTIKQSGKYYIAQASCEEGPFGEPQISGSFSQILAHYLPQMQDGGEIIYFEDDKSALVTITSEMASSVNTQIVAAKLRQDLMTPSERLYVQSCIAAIDGPTGRRC